MYKEMWSTRLPCAACITLGHICDEGCVFAPYFTLDDLYKFECVKELYGADNAARILLETPVAQRAATARSLVYESMARLNDPIYGCAPQISSIEERIKKVEADLHIAREELANTLRYQLPWISRRKKQLVEVDFFWESQHHHDQHKKQSMDHDMSINRGFVDDAGPSEPTLSLGGLYESITSPIKQQQPRTQEALRFVQQFIQPQFMVQQQNQPSQPQQQDNPQPPQQQNQP